MPIISNVAREKLEQNELSLGCGVRLTRSVEIAVAMKTAGFDWLCLDLEHGTMSIDAAAQIATAALDAGIAPLARVPNGEYSIATRLLDNGALGIVMPHVMGARFILSGNDAAFLMASAVQRTGFLRKTHAPS